MIQPLWRRCHGINKYKYLLNPWLVCKLCNTRLTNWLNLYLHSSNPEPQAGRAPAYRGRHLRGASRLIRRLHVESWLRAGDVGAGALSLWGWLCTGLLLAGWLGLCLQKQADSRNSWGAERLSGRILVFVWLRWVSKERPVFEEWHQLIGVNKSA